MTERKSQAQMKFKVKEVYVELQVMVNLGNYESTRVTCGLTVAMEDGESVDAVHKACCVKVSSMLQKQASLMEPMIKKLLER